MLYRQRHLLWDDAAVAAAVARSKLPKPKLAKAADPEATTTAATAAASTDAATALPALRIVNLEAFEAARNYGEKSDILRYEILSQV